MLFGNKEKTVELVLENLIWGNITYETKTDYRPQYAMDVQSFKKKMMEWVHLAENEPNTQELDNMTEELYHEILKGRIEGNLRGQLIDRDKDLEFEKLKADNLNLAKILDQAYIANQDKKIGTA